MPVDIQINNKSFGQTSNLADTLIIEVLNNDLYFCELLAEKNAPLFVCHVACGNNDGIDRYGELIQVVKSLQFAQKKYEHVFVNYFSTQFTMCPTNFYSDEHKRSLLEFNAGDISNHLIFTDDVNSEIKLIYAVEEYVASGLDLLFPHHQLKHTLTVLSKLMLQSEELVKSDILLSIENNHIEIVLRNKQTLLLVNQFSVKTQEDVLYYVLFVIEQYQLNPLTVSIYLVGNIDSVSPLIASLKKYIKNIKLGLGNKSIDWQGIAGMPQHFNYSLLNRVFCE